MNMKAFVQQHSLPTYFGLAYAIAWGGSLLVAGATRFQGKAISSEQIYLMMFLMLVAPGVAGVLVTASTVGRDGLRDLWARMGRWRVAARWYAVSFLVAPLLLLGILITLSLLVSPAYRPGFNLFYGIVAGGLAGFFEEIGWSGFATPRLLQKHGVLTAGLLLGVLWGGWHMMAGFLGSTPGQEAFWASEFLLFWVGALTAYRILMTWLYSKTGSVLVAQIMHAFFTGTLVAVAPTLRPEQTLGYETIFAICLWMGVVILAFVHYKDRMRQRQRAQAFS